MHRVNVILLVPYSSTLRNCRNSRPGGKERPRAAMSKSNYQGGGTTGLTKTFINASRDRKSLPTQVRATMGFGNLCFARLGSEAHRPARPRRLTARMRRCMCGQATSTATACDPIFA